MPWHLVEGVHREKTVNAGRQPGAQARTGDTHLFAFMDVTRRIARERVLERVPTIAKPEGFAHIYFEPDGFFSAPLSGCWSGAGGVLAAFFLILISSTSKTRVEPGAMSSP